MRWSPTCGTSSPTEPAGSAIMASMPDPGRLAVYLSYRVKPSREHALLLAKWLEKHSIGVLRMYVDALQFAIREIKLAIL